ncbi:terminase small subunit [Phytobacter ursingii]|uniref:Terminase small subunit n=1 Tax=Phytobacter ursingii TaxID=1972431 RepID=A0AB35RK56_9ENTR|nr:terminase small subunit [Phytobacter ursingii]MDV2861839.1 terminase small subunit [Phytobacter ursingii]
MASKKLTAEQQQLFDALTPLQKKFALALIKGKNQTDAYRKAGGKAKGDNLRKAAHVLATNCDVQAFLKSVQGEIVDEAIMGREEALKRLTSLGRISLYDIAEFRNGVIGEDEDGQPVIQASWSFKDSALLTPEALAAISELTAGPQGLKIKMHDPKAAIKQLAEMQGWEAPKKSELSGPGGGPIQHEDMTDEQLKEALQELGYGRRKNQLEEKLDNS